MGAKGIRRRKPVHHLPPVEDGVGRPDQPPIMWPGAGSGFEADPFSPAGQSQAMWRFWDGIRFYRDRPESGPLRWFSWLMVIFVAVPALAATVYCVVRLVR